MNRETKKLKYSDSVFSRRLPPLKAGLKICFRQHKSSSASNESLKVHVQSIRFIRNMERLHKHDDKRFAFVEQNSYTLKNTPNKNSSNLTQPLMSLVETVGKFGSLNSYYRILLIPKSISITLE